MTNECSEQTALRAFYDLFGQLGMTMINEATLEQCLVCGINEIGELRKSEAENAALRAQVEGLRAALEFAMKRIEQWAPDARKGPTDAWGGLVLWIKSALAEAALATQLPPGKKSDTRKSAENA